MWFKNLMLFRFAEPFTSGAEELAQALERAAFRACTPHELSSQGWVPPLGRRASELVHAANGCLLVCLQTEEKVLPPAVVKEIVADQVAEIEEREQRRVRRHEKENIRDDVLQALVPRALSRSRQDYAYIDPQGGWLVVDGAGRRVVEGLTGQLRKTLGSLPVVPPRVADSPAAVMTRWLADGEIPADWQPQDECELRDDDETGGVVRCRGQDLGGDEIRVHLQAGKLVTRLGLIWDERIAFVLGEDLSVRRLRFLDVVRESLEDVAAETAEQLFDAQFALMTGELGRFLPRLLEAFGGEQA